MKKNFVKTETLYYFSKGRDTQIHHKLILPDHPVFQQLTQDGADLAPLESTATRELFAKEVYNVDSYVGRLREVEADRPIIEQAFPRFQNLNAQWGFKMFPRYEIALTHFGTLGSYDEKLGKIIVSIQVKWPPKKTAIHEGVHIGIESNVVQRFGLSHWEKERVVDLICSLRFGDLLPGYILQPQGDEKINPFVKDKNLGDLPKSISEYIKIYPRK